MNEEQKLLKRWKELKELETTARKERYEIEKKLGIF
jgi:hypothetical protein